MAVEDPIADLEAKMQQAYQSGDYQRAKHLESQLRKIRGQRAGSPYLQDDPYSLEGRSFSDE